MKIILELKENIKLNNGDLLVYEKPYFTKISKSALLRELVELNNDRISDVNRLEDIISKLEKRIYILELKAKYDAGEIGKEEYELCLGNN